MNTTVATLKALADRNRLRIVLALDGAGELCACQITELLRVSGATASRHLSRLERAGLLLSRKDGRWIHYRLARTADAPLAWARESVTDHPDLAADRAALQGIMAENPTDLCRRQRGESCCPSTKDPT